MSAQLSIDNPMSLYLPLLAAASFNCPVQVMPVDASAKWVDAANQAGEQITLLTNSEKDCSVIIVQVHPKGAQVTMTTTDGRRATRPIRTPDEIFPVVRALVVTVSIAAKQQEAQPRPPLKRHSDEASFPKPAAGPIGPPGDSSRSEREVFLIAAGGARLSNPVMSLSPLAALSAAAQLGNIELGLTASREVGYRALSATAPAAFVMSATAVGVFAGLRQPVGPLAVVAGMQGSTAFVSERATIRIPCSEEDTGNCADYAYDGTITRRVTEGRLGAYLASVLPLTHRFRVRAQLDFNWVAARLRDTSNPQVYSYSLPAPSWGMALSLGVEGRVL